MRSVADQSRGRQQKLWRRAIVVALAVAVIPDSSPATVTGQDAPSRSAGRATAMHDAYAKLPLSFEANLGQTDPQVEFLARGSGYTIYLTRGGAVLALRASEHSANAKGRRDAVSDGKRSVTTSLLRMHVLGAEDEARARPENHLPGRVNYFIGDDPSKWRVGLPTYGRIVYPDIYPGIDVVYYGNQGALEYDFVVKPGADYSAIALRYEGHQALDIDSRGDLLLRVGDQTVRQTRPLSYQDGVEERREIPAAYVVGDDGTVHFDVGAYDPTRPLVIDPRLLYSTYIGGIGGELGASIAVDSLFGAYVTGSTQSADFPTSSTAFQPGHGGGTNDAFVTKLNPAGTALVYATYLGGSHEDGGSGIAVDSIGNAYVTGRTQSTNFPTTFGAFDTAAPPLGSANAFVTKLDQSGSALIYSTYLRAVRGTAITVDSSLNAYVTGSTTGDFPTFPTTVGAFDTTFNGVTDAFVTKLNPTGSALVYSTYLGGGSFDIGEAIAVDSAANAYITGSTSSTNFPTTAAAYQTSLRGNGDAFIAKLNATGSAPLMYSTYLGGSGGGPDRGNAIAVDPFFNAYVAGLAATSDFPTTPGAFQSTARGVNDAFVAKLNPAGSMLVYSTYLGGSSGDVANGIALDPLLNAYVTGQTGSTDFPTTVGAFQRFNGGLLDGFVTKVDPTGVALAYSTYLGGSGHDTSTAIVLDSALDAYVTGVTQSADFPTTSGALDQTQSGASDAFVAKITETGPPATLMLSPAMGVNAVGDSHCVSATVTDGAGQPAPGITVRFSVIGAEATSSSPSTGSGITNNDGQTRFCFSAALPGDNLIHAFADSDEDGTEDAPGEPSGNANKTWILPASTELCEVVVTGAGRITAINGDRARFHGVARSDAAGNASGNQFYEDGGPVQPMTVESTAIRAVTCSVDRTTVNIFGEATIDGAGSFQFRIRVTDNGPGNTGVYGIILSNGYASGDQVLEVGSVRIN